MAEQQEGRASNRHRSVTNRLRVASIAALVALGCTTVATTAGARSIYRGAFDPVDISGTVDVGIPDNCLGTGSGWNFVDAMTCGGGDTVDVDDATVNIVYTPPDSGPSPIQFSGPAPSYSGGYSGAVAGLYWNGTDLVAITTAMFGSSSSPTEYFLQFGAIPDYDGNDLVGVTETSVDLYHYVCTSPPAGLRTNAVTTYDADNDCNCTYDEIAPEIPTRQLSFARVPEPGTLMLVFGALGAGWIGLRRRRS